MTASTLHLQPAPGMRVLDPMTREPLPAEGCEVRVSSYWLRRLADGDVIEIPVPAVDELVQASAKTAVAGKKTTT